MLIAGSFAEYPLFLLMEIFHHRRETGLLEVSSPNESGYFYIKNGEIKDGEFGKVRGLEAIELARGLEDASFSFKMLEPAEYARVVWEKNFGGLRLGGHANLPRSHSTLRHSLVHVATVFGGLEKALVSLTGQARTWGAATYGSLESAAVLLARQAQSRTAAAYRNLERAVVSTARQVQPQGAAACSSLEKAATSTAVRTRSFATAAFNNLEKGAASAAGRTHSYATPAYSNLKKAAVLTVTRTDSYTAPAYELTERAQAVRNRLSVLCETIDAWQTAGRHRLKRFQNEVIVRCALKLRLERAVALIKKGAAMFPRLFQEPTRTRLVFGIIITSILIATLVTISQIGQRTDQASPTPIDATASSNNESKKRSKKASGKRSHERQGTGPALAHKAVANNEKARQQLTSQNSSEGYRGAGVMPQSKPLSQEKEPARVQASSERSGDSKASKTQPTSTPGFLNVPVVLQIENGRVSQASILKHRAGMEAYEAEALRIVRERRYAGAVKRTDTVMVKVNQRPD
ncbi:MAG TPA: DUF4388 domain-containing protein [Pyrinomonadaceae bacterium]